jgi:hypothetical protein
LPERRERERVNKDERLASMITPRGGRMTAKMNLKMSVQVRGMAVWLTGLGEECVCVCVCVREERRGEARRREVKEERRKRRWKRRWQRKKERRRPIALPTARCVIFVDYTGTYIQYALHIRNWLGQSWNIVLVSLVPDLRLLDF